MQLVNWCTYSNWRACSTGTLVLMCHNVPGGILSPTHINTCRAEFTPTHTHNPLTLQHLYSLSSNSQFLPSLNIELYHVPAQLIMPNSSINQLYMILILHSHFVSLHSHSSTNKMLHSLLIFVVYIMSMCIYLATLL